MDISVYFAVSQKYETVKHHSGGSVQGNRKKEMCSLENWLLSSASWGSERELEFKELQDALQTAVKLAHVKNDQVISVFADASERYGARVVTQTKMDTREKDIERQEL